MRATLQLGQDLKYPEHINKFYNKSGLWHSAYFIASCEGVTASILRQGQ